MRARTLGFVPVLVGLLLALMAPLSPARAATASLTGPDVASYQHPRGAAINWPAVRSSGQSFAFVKATESTGYTNPYFAGDWKGIASAGLYRGAYHFARPNATAGSATAQADFFAATIGGQRLTGTLPPVLDLEDNGGLGPADLQAWVQTFLTELQTQTGRVPMIYTYPNFWQTRMASSMAFTRYPLWIAHYGVSAPQSIGWPYTFWQYTSGGTVNGISTPGNTDMNKFSGTAKDLSVLALEGSWGAAKSTAATEPGPDPASTSRYIAVTPYRLFDTRSGGPGVPRQPVRSALTVALPASVPTTATGVVLDVSAVGAAGSGYLRVARAGTTPQTTALNYVGGTSTTALAVTAMDSRRQVTFSPVGAPVDLVVDVVGYFTSADGIGGRWVPLTPVRAADSRSGQGVPAGAHTGALTFTLPGSVPTSATGVALNITALSPQGTGYLRIAPAGSPAATTALNFDGSGSTTGLALTSTNQGRVTITVSGAATGLVVDVLGYYEGTSAAGSGGGYLAVNPQRFLDTRSGLGASGPGNGGLTMALPNSVPSTATAVLVNVSVIQPSGPGYLQLSAPGSSTATTVLNLTGARDVTVLALAPVSNGRISFALYGSNAHVVLDLVGFQVPPTG